MDWKGTLLEGQADILKALKIVQAQLVAQGKEIRTLRAQMELVAKNKGESAERMADRLIEMAMVNKGLGRDASIHRRYVKDDKPEDLWQDTPEKPWPPPGCDELRMP